eukprot:gnl/TRDRNA2_/TRDRNA2_81402_c0_seq1.p1 gnl/TRDRNA2_/TRDRNA2_81402_c0~~gnl/TRDRNA2_/TRDRNA2_81402_c0_seq1.p1  ORF type:complete len:263 (+),score=69.19 gnl/TRDRNA2_/TRDRNA2_81402_c0_seq1:3-791(+)
MDMTSCDVHGYVKLENRKAPQYRRHVLAVCCCILSVGVVVTFCKVAGADRQHYESLVAMRSGSLQQRGLFNMGSGQRIRYRPQAGLFDMFNKKDSPEQAAKDEAWRTQQEILARRRDKQSEREYFTGVQNRREAAEKNFRNSRIQYKKGEDNLVQWKKLNKGKEDRFKDDYKDAPKNSIPIPMASFGMPKFDNGERFDLRLPYVDNGYVAEDSEDAWSRFKGLLDFKGALGLNKEEEARKAAAEEAARKAEEEAAKKKSWWR